jgi:hypothetical protein
MMWRVAVIEYAVLGALMAGALYVAYRVVAAVARVLH